jgi:predicted amino acid-binding ACT domain protein
MKGNAEMKNITISLLILALSLGILISISGCGPNKDTSVVRKAKLVGDENIRLKKQLDLKDKEIGKLNETIAEKDAEITRVKQQSGDSSLKIMQHLVQGETAVKQLTAENKQLKAKIKQLEAKLAEK